MEPDDVDFYDEENRVVFVSVDRVTIAIGVEDFEEFYEQVTTIRNRLLADPEIALGSFEEDGVVKRQFIYASSDDKDFS
jgi:hypothetical protein